MSLQMKLVFLINRILILMICDLTLVFAQAKIGHRYDLEALSSSVAFLKSEHLATKPYGTGFFIVENNHLFLITAAHISKFLDKKSTVTIKGSGDIPLTYNIGNLINISHELVWIKHNKADIALLKLNPDPETFIKLQGHFLPSSILEIEKKAPHRAKILTVLGFPLSLGVKGVFSPISKETKSASGLLNLLRADTKIMATFFVTQDPSIGGYSGAPVFDTGLPYSTSNTAIYVDMRETKILGIVHGTISDKTGGKLGAIVPSYYIVETIKMALNK